MAMNTAYFARMPRANIPHTKQKRPFVHAGTCLHGDIVPIYCKLVMPGEIVKDKFYGNIRMNELISPVYSTIKVGYHAFFVPIRLLWDHAKNFFGESDDLIPVQPGDFKIPMIKYNNDDFDEHSNVVKYCFAHYLRYPLFKNGQDGTDGYYESSVLKARAYWKIIDDYFRAEQVQAPIVVDTSDDGNKIGVKNGSSIDLGSNCQKTLKDFDYFTTMTRFAEYGPDVMLPLGTVAPVIAGSGELHSAGGAIKFGKSSAGSPGPAWFNNNGELLSYSGQTAPSTTARSLDSTNLVADLSRATAATIDELYIAMAAQAWYHNSNFGNRYFEYLEIHFGVNNPDLVLNRSQHFGEIYKMINVQQVLATATNDETHLGQPGANSSTNVELDFPAYAVGEWGFIIITQSTFAEHYYTGGILREDLYEDLFDFYHPEFANIPDQGVYQAELFFNGSSALSGKAKDIIGFQECWSEFRYTPNQLSGDFDPYNQSVLPGWVTSEKWNNSPELSEEFLLENRDGIKRLLVSQNGPDYIFYYYLDETSITPLPIKSKPGLPSRGRIL